MARPQRFALRLPVRYRSRSESSWHYGMTASLSASGAVIEGEPPASATPLVVAIDLPASEGCLVGRARIVGERSAALEDSSRFVITVRRFRIAHRR